MKRIITYFYKTRNQETILGRWKMEKCDTKTNHKVDWANEDHCGPCGSVQQNKSQEEKKKDTPPECRKL